MPSSLVSAYIRGIRSYSPAETDGQRIEFMPLTLIVGSNGSGKTTIIESLKFIVSGEEPPHSDCRRNFIHTPRPGQKFKGDPDKYAVVEIKFKNSFGEICKARREIALPLATNPPSLVSGYQIGTSPFITVHRQDDWNKVLPKLFGLPNQAILSHVILCHQEDNLWCMGDSSVVKQIFDRIFGCEQYKKEIKHIDEEIKKIKKLVAPAEKDIIYFGDQVRRKKFVLSQLDRLTSEIKRLGEEVNALEVEVKTQTEKRRAKADQIRTTELRAQDLRDLNTRIKSLAETDKTLRSSLVHMTYKRPAPVQKPVQTPKKPAPDPIIADFDSVLNNVNKMISVVDAVPISDEISSLKVLIRDTLGMIQAIKSKFVVAADEPPPPPPQEDPSPDDLFLQGLEARRKQVQNQIDRNMTIMEEIREQITFLEEKAKEEPDLEKAKKELTEIEHKIQEAREKRSHKSGSRTQIERELSSHKSDLINYKDSNKNYAKSLGVALANQVVISDLEKLKKCFQESITTFHDQMILKINEVLRSRWRQIYQGSDIESIELVDEPLTRGKVKTYNYYMAMRKNGIRMKMREKSSAGQRALAAIILRMALAELLVRDFAFIALDEPTANLDLANVQALAKSIGAYVRRRTKKAAKIQWIIITHDEQFLRALDEECSPFFYRVHMDKTSGYSKIVKVSCQEAEVWASSEVVAN